MAFALGPASTLATGLRNQCTLNPNLGNAGATALAQGTPSAAAAGAAL